VICPPLGVPLLAWRALRRVRFAGDCDVIHCWSAGASRLARLALRREPTVVGHSALPPPACPVRTPVERTAARAALGVGPGTLVLALLGRGHDADALRLARMVGALEYAGVSIVGLVPAWARQQSRAKMFAKRFGTRIQLVMSDAPAVEALRGADLALWDREGAGDSERDGDAAPAAWFIAEAHAAGVPVIAARDADVGGLYPPGAAEACLAFNPAVPELTRVVLKIADDESLLRRLSMEVRDHAHAVLSAEALAVAAMSLWEGGGAAAGAPVVETRAGDFKSVA
jgi:hypothetical protein